MRDMFDKIVKFKVLYPDAKLSENCLKGLTEDDTRFMRFVGIIKPV